MIVDSNVIGDTFTFKEIYPLWNLSMMTQKDEINSDRHLNMTFVEFVEAICRVADKLSIPNLIEDHIEPEDWTNPTKIKEWGQRDFSMKIESFLLVLNKNCLGNDKFLEETK